MLPRLYRRRLWRRVLVALVGLALFTGAVWLALMLGRPTPPGRVRVVASGRSEEPRYLVSEEGRAVRLREQVGGEEREFEIRSTDEGLLIVPREHR